MKEREAGELEEEWGFMKESFVGHASDVCGKRFVGGCMKDIERKIRKPSEEDVKF